MSKRQKTIKERFSYVCWVGNIKKLSTITVHPALEGTGICFVRLDAENNERLVKVAWERAVHHNGMVSVSNEFGIEVHNIHYLIAAFHLINIQNAVIEIDCAWLGIEYGQFTSFMGALYKAGIQELDTPLLELSVKQSLMLERGAAFAVLTPAEQLVITLDIESQEKPVDGWCLACFNSKEYEGRDIELGKSFNLAISSFGRPIAQDFIRKAMLSCLGVLAMADARIKGEYHAVTYTMDAGLEMLKLLHSSVNSDLLINT